MESGKGVRSKLRDSPVTRESPKKNLRKNFKAVHRRRPGENILMEAPLGL